MAGAVARHGRCLIGIKGAKSRRDYLTVRMPIEGPPGSAEELLCACEKARGEGQDFPTVWNTLLKRSRLVIGLPSHEVADGEARIVIRLVTGQRLLSAARGFSLA